jgi:hypothetical protein
MVWVLFPRWLAANPRSARMMDTVADNELSNVSPEEAELRKWIIDWYAYAMSVSFIEPPYELDNATAERLEGYCKVGLTPNEGAGAMFGRLH